MVIDRMFWWTMIDVSDDNHDVDVVNAGCDDFYDDNDDDDDCDDDANDDCYELMIKMATNKDYQGELKTRPDTRAKTVRRALIILRPIPSSIRPIPSSIRPIPSSIRPIPSSIRPVLSSIRPI